MLGEAEMSQHTTVTYAGCQVRWGQFFSVFFAGRIKELSRPIFQAKVLIGLPFLRKMLTGEIAKSDLIPPPPHTYRFIRHRRFYYNVLCHKRSCGHQYKIHCLKTIDLPRYNMKCSGEKKILSERFQGYIAENLDYFWTVYVTPCSSGLVQIERKFVNS